MFIVETCLLVIDITGRSGKKSDTKKTEHTNTKI